MHSNEDIDQSAFLDFLACLAADRLAKRTRSASDYRELFPGCAAAVADELAAASAAVDTGGPISGRRIGPYLLVRELGRGGQGAVYLAHDARLKRLVALKVHAAPFAALSTEARLRREREAAALSRIDHPGVGVLYETGSDGGTDYTAMRYVPGESLARLLATRATPPKTKEEILRTLRFVEKLARAAHAAHEAGVVHRDIKPANVILDRRGDPVLVDFGLAHGGDPDGAPLTATGDVLGTPGYIAPEIVTGRGRFDDPRLDVWSIGAVLFEMLTARRAVHGVTPEQTLRQTADFEASSARPLNGAISGDVDAIVRAALDPWPERRYASAAAMANDLARAAALEPVLARPAGSWTRTVRWAERNPALAATSILCVLILAAAAVLGFVLERRARTALGDVTRIADLKKVSDLRREAEDLWPAIPERVGGEDGIDAWLRRAEDVRSRLDRHREARARFATERGGAVLGDDAAARDWWRTQLDQLVVDVEALATLIETVEKRRERALSIDQRTILGPYGEAWKKLREKIAVQRGLVPLGPDPESGLLEFAHIESGEPPQRGPDGRLEIRDETGIVLVLLPGGAFRMGVDRPTESRPTRSPNIDENPGQYDGPSHEVVLDPFFLSKYELTQAQWLRLTGKNPSNVLPGHTLSRSKAPLLNPVEQISRLDFERYLARIDLEIPTEAQWEYGARGGAGSLWWTGDEKETLCGAGNLCDAAGTAMKDIGGLTFETWMDDGHIVTAPVGSFRPNGFGLHDVVGNVSEFARDTWEDYSTPPRPGDGLRAPHYKLYVWRGASFMHAADTAKSARRNGSPGDIPSQAIGCRPSRSVRP